MYASIFCFDLGDSAEDRERWRYGRSLAAELDAVPGFVAFIAFETGKSAAAGVCICVDEAALQTAQEVAVVWQHGHAVCAEAAFQPLIAGEVFVQRGF